MNKYIKALNCLKPTFIILFSFLIFVSCKKGDVEKPENVCTLTAEQMPDVRGFRLGMSYDAVKQRFPNICNNDSKIKIKTYKGSAENTSSVVSNCESVNIENYPELEGISEVGIILENRQASNILITYDKTTDKEFQYTFRYKIKKSLGISEFTNSNYASNILSPERKQYEMEGEETLCNKVNFLIATLKYVNVSPSYYEPILLIQKSDKVAITKAQQEQEKKAAENQKKAEDQKKRETFKP